MQEHHAIVRDVLAGFPEGVEIETAGDSFLLTFETPSEGVRFALKARQALREWNAGREIPIQDRYALHMGEVVLEGGSLYSIHVDTCARVLGLADSERLLLTRPVFDSARQHLKRDEVGLQWVSHGPYLLKGVEEPIEVCEVIEAGDGPRPPPPDSDKATRQDPAGSHLVTGWRPAIGELVPGTAFRLEARLGEGAVGEAWVAANKSLGERRVFKFCFQPERVRSLRREVALFRLMRERLGDHPGIVGVVDVHLDEAPYFLVFEWVEAGDLLGWLTPEVPVATRVELVAQVAEALQSAHEAGVVHRDVKPANILVDAKARPIRARLTDFGVGQVMTPDVIAGLTRAALGETILVGSGSSSHTGTQIFLAPELLAGRPASPRSDLYALGIVLWQLLVGDLRRPLPPDWPLAVEDPLLREDLSLVLAGDPERRLSSTLELARRLRSLPERRARAEADRLALRETELRAYRKGILRATMAAGAIVVLVAGLALVAANQARKAERAEEEARSLAEENRQALYEGRVEWGRSRLAQGDRLGALPHFAEALAVATGPSIAVAQMRLAEALATGPRLVAVVELGEPGADVALSPDGRRMVTVERTGIGGTQAPDRGAARLWDLATASAIATFDLQARGWNAAYAPDGRTLTVVSESKAVEGTFETRSSIVRIFDAETLSPIGEPLDDETPVSCSRRTGGFTDDGRSVWAADPCGDLLAVWDVRTGARLPMPDVSDGVPCAISEDGLVVLACSKTTGGESRALHALDRSTGRVRKTIRGPLSHGIPLSLDGRGTQVAYDFVGVGSTVEDLTGDGPPRTLQHDDLVYRARLSRDGSLVTTSSRDGTARVWSARTGEPVSAPLWHRHQVQGAALSDDGRWLATASFDKLARVWDLKDPARPTGAFAGERPLDALDGRILVLTAEGRFLWRDKGTGAATGPGLPLAIGDRQPDFALFALLDGGSVLYSTGGSEYSVFLGDVDQGKVVASWPCTETSGCIGSARSAAGPIYVTAPGGLRPIDAKTGADAGPLVPTGSVTAVSWAPEGPTALVVTLDGSRLWDLAAGTPRSTVLPQFRQGCVGQGWIAGLPIERAGQEFAGRAALVLSSDGAREMFRFENESAWVSAACSPDGRRLAAGTIEGDLYVWDIPSGERRLGPLRAGAEHVGLGWSDDGRFLVDHSAFGAPRIFDAATGEFVAETPSLSWRPLESRGEFFHYEPLVDERSVDDWRLIASVLAVERVGAGARISPEELVASWRSLRERYPDEFTPSDGPDVGP